MCYEYDGDRAELDGAWEDPCDGYGYEFYHQQCRKKVAEDWDGDYPPVVPCEGLYAD